MIPLWAGKETPTYHTRSQPLALPKFIPLGTKGSLRLEVNRKGITNGNVLPVLCQVLPHRPQQVPVLLGISKVLLVVCRFQHQVGHINNPDNPTTCPAGRRNHSSVTPLAHCLGLKSSPWAILTCPLLAVGPLSHTSWSGGYSYIWTCHPGPDVQCWPQKQNSVP